MSRDVLIYELDHPESANAFGVKQAQEIIELLTSASCSAFILQSRGRLFCAGGNLSDYASMKTPAAGRNANRVIGRALKMINDLPVPTLCLVQGDCWGGGLELISAFDHVITAPEASFGFWQRRIGLTFGWGGGMRLLKRVSARRLLGLSLQTRAVGAHEALRVGLVDEVVLRSQFARATGAWLTRVETGSRAPVPFFKAMLSKSGRALGEKTEASVFQKLWWGRDHLAALKPHK